jgi:hypothetical protein
LPEGGFLALLMQTELSFNEVPRLKRGEPSTSFKVRGHKLKVDLLVPVNNSPYKPIRVSELGTHATGLPCLAYVLENPTMSILIGRDRIVPVAMLHPRRFCIHKLAVHTLRDATDNAKSEKDIFPSAVFAAALAEERDFFLQEAIDTMNSRSKPT